MTTTQTRTAPSRRVPPAALQPGPVTLAIRGLRPNEAPTWEIRQAQIAAEEREALRALRRRVAQAVSDGIDFLDQTGGDPDLEADFATVERAADGSLFTRGRSSDDEPSIGGDDREDENEHGGDINDEPHDPEEDRGAMEDEVFPGPVQFSGHNYHSVSAR